MGGGQELVIPPAVRIPVPAAASTAAASSSTPAAAAAAAVALSTSAEFSEVAAGQAEEILVTATVKAGPSVGVRRPSIDVVCVIDRSGSMAGAKLDLTRAALKFIVSQLRPDDQFCIVTYDTAVNVVVQLAPMTAPNQDRATKLINSIVAGSSTNLSGGLFRGLDEVAARRTPNAVCSVLLMTDGEANHGIVDPAEILTALRAQLNRAGVEGACTIYTFGYGSDHNATLLRSIADAGRGVYYYVDRPAVVPQSFGTCLGGLTSVVANRMSVRVTARDGVKVTKVFLDASTVDGAVPGTGFAHQLGDISAEEERDVLFRVSVSATRNGEPLATQELASVALTYTDLIGHTERTVHAAVTIARPAAITGVRERNQHVEDQRLRIEAVEAIEEARRLADLGDFTSARRSIQSVTRHITVNAQRGAPVSPFQQALRGQMADTEELVSSAQQYGRQGSHIMSSRSQSNMLQRTTYDSRRSNDDQMYVTPQQTLNSVRSLAYSSTSPTLGSRRDADDNL